MLKITTTSSIVNEWFHTASRLCTSGAASSTAPRARAVVASTLGAADRRSRSSRWVCALGNIRSPHCHCLPVVGDLELLLPLAGL